MIDSSYLSSEIDGCKIIAVIQSFKVIVEINNFTPTPKWVDLSKLCFKIGEWYYKIPWVLWVDGYGHRQVEYYKHACNPVDNLTQIEELAKEKQLL
jgi:hypothetical protein